MKNNNSEQRCIQDLDEKEIPLCLTSMSLIF